MATELKPKHLAVNGVLAAIGAVLIVATSYLGEWGYVTMLMGLTFILFALLKIGLMVLEFEPVKKLKNDKSGVAWIWAVAALAICFCPLVYFAVGYPFDLIRTQMIGMYTLTGNMLLAWEATQVIVSYLLAFILFFIVVWSWVNTHAQR